MEIDFQLILILVISFLSLFFSFFWISAFYFEEPYLHKGYKKLKHYPKVSIIIPAYNEEDCIAETLKSLLTLDYPKDKLELIVVANACKDRTVEIVKQFKHVKLIETPIGGKARAQNLGIKAAKGEIVVITDADVVVKSDSLVRLLPYFEDPEVAEVVPAVKAYKPENLLQKVQRYEYIVSAFIKQMMSGLGIMFLAPGAFNAYRKSVMLKLGGFDENTLTEDLEIATRLLKEHYKVVSNIDAQVAAKVPRTLRAFHTQRLRWDRGFVEVVSKHRNMLFNPRYGFLGLLFPLSILIPVMLAVTISIALFKLASIFSNFAFLITIEDLKLIITEIIPKGPLYWNTLLLVPTVTVLVTGVYLYNKANEHLKERWTNPLAIFVFFFVYPLWLTFYWLLAFVTHMTKMKKVWRGGVRW